MAGKKGYSDKEKRLKKKKKDEEEGEGDKLFLEDSRKKGENRVKREREPLILGNEKDKRLTSKL